VNAATDDPLPPDAVEVGRVLGAWGIQGGIKVKPYAADPQALFSSRRWYVEPPAAPAGPAVPGVRGAVPLPRLLRITEARSQGEWVVARAQELPDRNAAEAMRGARILVSRASFPTPDADEFYWVDLIGLAVVNREGVPLGTVAGLIETGPHCVLRLARAEGEGAERLIPFVNAYVDRVDLGGRCIHVDWDAAD
jgi:16S rRNA processing protein RimM